MITLQTHELMMVIIAFSGPDGLDSHILHAAELLRAHAQAEIKSTTTV